MKMTSNEKYHKLAQFGIELLEKTSIEEGIPLITKYLKELTGADRTSIFIYDEKNNRLWSTYADGLKYIELDADKGIAGKAIRERNTVVVNDAYSHPDFFSKVDENTDYVTKNIIATPIFSSSHKILGVLEAINKEGGFSSEDVKFMQFFAHYVSSFLELIEFYEADKHQQKPKRGDVIVEK